MDGQIAFVHAGSGLYLAFSPGEASNIFCHIEGKICMKATSYKSEGYRFFIECSMLVTFLFLLKSKGALDIVKLGNIHNSRLVTTESQLPHNIFDL
jgi:hypothetical protein